MRPRWFCHVDMDAFYASVEVLDRPALAGLPIAVGGPADKRGVIAAASYAARRFGVRSAMPTATALRLCPQLVLLSGRMRRYQEKSREVMDILREVAPAVEPLSLDEAALDLTGCERLHRVGPWADTSRPDWSAVALDLRERIRRETGLWASIGMGETRRIAKMASDMRKPRGLVVVEPGAGVSFLAALPVGRIWGVGPRLRERLESLGMRTAGDVARTPRSVLRSALGRTGPHLHDVVNARETGEVHPDRASKSVSHETTFARDLVGHEALEPVLLRLSEKVGGRLRHEGLLGRVVQLKIRDRGFHTFTRRLTLDRPTDSEKTIYETARRLLRGMGWEQVPVRLLGVGLSGLSGGGARQGDLFATAEERRRPRLERVLDTVHERFGDDSIGRGRGLVGRDVAAATFVAADKTARRRASSAQASVDGDFPGPVSPGPAHDPAAPRSEEEARGTSDDLGSPKRKPLS